MIKPPRKPKLFIGSSREAIHYAKAVHSVLHKQKVVQVIPWYDGTFRGNMYTMEDLERRLDECDYAVFIFAADDVALIRGKHVFITRDNTIFEMGLFWGKLRRMRVFCVVPQEVEVSDGEHIKGIKVDKLHVLSDLNGLTLLEYEYAHDNEFEAAVSVACGEIKKNIESADEPFFIDPVDQAQRCGRIVKLLWEYARIVPITEDALLTQKYHALCEAIRISFAAPPIGNSSVTHVALYSKQGSDGMKFVGGNIDKDAFYSFQTDNPNEEPNIVTKVQRSSQWTFTHEQHFSKVSVLCYPLGNEHVLSVRLTGDTVLSKDHLQMVVEQNAELLTTIKHLVGGDSK
ncbi:TIR domain-containing protein [Brevibacillus sp. H7]|uniref:TIR domain-containing protein n=1 Tax=Brevibacillus sp. H7 TaxID=3349138 RepID=UPI00382725BB